ncbi:MAG: phage major tail protein, TP901-1 family [Pseudomonadota bacterium]
MTAQAGKDMLLKSVEPDNSTTTIAGLRTKRLTLNAQSVDITDADSNGRWRELLGGSGQRRASLSASGIFKDQTSDEIMRTRFFNGEIADWQLLIPDFGTLTGLWQISSLEYAGTFDGEVTFDIAMESAGALAFEVLA